MFLGNPITYIRVSHGLKEKNYELRLMGCSFTYDIFLNFKLKDNRQCSFYHGDKKVYTYVILILNTYLYIIIN